MFKEIVSFIFKITLFSSFLAVGQSCKCYDEFDFRKFDGYSKRSCNKAKDLALITYEDKIYPDYFQVQYDTKGSIECISYSVYKLQKVGKEKYQLYIFNDLTEFVLSIDSSWFKVNYVDTIWGSSSLLKTSLDLKKTLFIKEKKEDFNYSRFINTNVSQSDTSYLFDEVISEFVGIPENFFFEPFNDSLKLREYSTGDLLSRYLFTHRIFQRYSVSKKYYYHFLFNKVFFDEYFGVKFISEPIIRTAPISDYFQTTRYNDIQNSSQIVIEDGKIHDMEKYLWMLKCLTRGD